MVDSITEDDTEESTNDKYSELVIASKSMISKIENLSQKLSECEIEKSGIEEKVLSLKRKLKSEKSSSESLVKSLHVELEEYKNLVSCLENEKLVLKKSFRRSKLKI